ncbi:hypothetical protein PR202_ga00758 [Eleusine coracana subsp. coracana]|uniref:Uncharacterized protein n=1 Tax=Eleusine coracana subsp. coracana TaxID=191504 RepID=A0AAV5BHB2_ELECO|nr:hypothetical protein QOZ80_2AG0131090 [Eleusine coracana subsp. coracana]GJM85030.1 hypothetical protein PR202_ga00758 [Eleusine coracana subsp. coracana]
MAGVLVGDLVTSVPSFNPAVSSQQKLETLRSRESEPAMDVQIERTFVIPPPPCELEETPFTVFDLLARPAHVTVLYAFSAPSPSNEALLSALTAVLPHFPLLSAHIERHPVTNRPFFVTGKGGKGVLVVEANVSTALSDHLPLAPSPDLALLQVPSEEGNCHMLKVQINRFACGGVVIVPSSLHQAVDGPSMNIFLQAWADTVRGNGVPPDSLSAPYGPRALVPRCPPRCEFQHRGVEFEEPSKSKQQHVNKQEEKDDGNVSSDDGTLSSDDGTVSSDDGQAAAASSARVDASEISNTLLHFDKDFIAELKAKAHNKYSTFETLSAHVWKKITAARGLLDDTNTSIFVAVNGRWRVGDSNAIPKDFFGNAIFSPSADAGARGLVGGSLADAAAKVRSAARAVDEPYLRSFIDFGAMNPDEFMMPTVVEEDDLLRSDLDLISWLHLGLHSLDFGCGGQLVGVLPAFTRLDGDVYLMPSLRKEGGVDVLVALWDQHAKQLQSIAYTMD